MADGALSHGAMAITSSLWSGKPPSLWSTTTIKFKSVKAWHTPSSPHVGSQRLVSLIQYFTRCETWDPLPFPKHKELDYTYETKHEAHLEEVLRRQQLVQKLQSFFGILGCSSITAEQKFFPTTEKRGLWVKKHGGTTWKQQISDVTASPQPFLNPSLKEAVWYSNSVMC